MPADHLLNTVLSLYQSVHDDNKTDQIIGSTVTLLSTLSNPLNLAVLTSELLTAPAIWHRHDGIRTSYRVISIYHSAARRIRQPDPAEALPGGRQPGRLGCDAWAKGVAKGADSRSNRWQHLLVLTGILMGMHVDDDGAGSSSSSLSAGLRNTLQEAVVKAANLALERPMQDGPVAAASISVALGFAMPHLSEFHLRCINSDALLPNAVWTLTGSEGFQDGQFLTPVNAGVSRSRQGDVEVMHWPAESASFRQIQQLDSKPVVGSMGATARLAMHAIQHAANPALVLQAQDALLEFTARIFEGWQACALSEVEARTEGRHLSPETLQVTFPILSELLRKVLYSVVAALQALVSRSILDPRLRRDPSVAAKTLHTLRNLFFISSRDGNSNFQAYTFASLCSVDILSRYPDAAAALLAEMRPDAAAGSIPPHPLGRTMDLHYLTLAEHFPPSLPSAASEALIVQPASVYLAQPPPPSSPLARDLFESAHSAVLSVLSCPQNSALATGLVPFYVDNLFSSFPLHISPRQFRVAFRTVTQIVSPPFPVSATNPDLAETLLEMLRFRAAGASPEPLPAALYDAAGGEGENEDVQLSEQSALLLALVDALPFLHISLLEEWLPVAAEAVGLIADPQLRLPVRKRLWDVLGSGEMDVERSSFAVTWWYSRGGKELVLGAAAGLAGQPVMSGALVEEEKREGGEGLSRL
ncbi:related to peroxisomal membrane protein PEX17 [Cephalotrichum gorgonifer]|uniref:Related to peroxisomal membrane protein PEX17 n=1 Tax=Cephalotrichum gorgonifer TaxID=2041049 RepID=A0AAE8MX02_9PEZI|nr:related to peroxisomal membrane protein PEX17 [Cephalotrichum gorgonifer]